MNKNALFFTGLCSLFMAGMPTVSATAESHTPGDDKATATQEKIEYISFGNFDNWLTRNIKESGIIGGKTKTLYEIAPNGTWNNNNPYNLSLIHI